MAEPRPRKPQRKEYTAFDRAMIAAAQNKTRVEFTVRGVPSFALICSVDTYFIEVCDEVDSSKKWWINKAHVEQVRIFA